MAKTDAKSRWLNVLIFVVIGLWAVAIGAYVARYRQARAPLEKPPPFKPRDGTAEARDEESWKGIYQGHTKIGYMFSRMRQDEKGLQLWSKTRIKMKLLDEVQVINLDLQGRLDVDYSIREIQFEAVFSQMEIKAKGIRKDNDLFLTLDTGGEKIEHTLHFDQPPTMEAQWLIREQLRQAKLGDEFSFSVFEPMSQKQMPVTIKVVAEEDLEIDGQNRPCWKVEMTLKGQLEWMWADKETGEVLKEFDPASGLTMIAESREKAMDVDWEEAGEVDLLITLMVNSDQEINNPRATRRLTARLLGASLDGLDTTLSGRQTRDGSTVEIDVQSASPAVGYALPIQDSLPEKAAELVRWLEPTPFIQSGHEKIQAAAAEALGDATDAVTALDRLLPWVSGAVKDSLVASIPSALEVLEKKKGACKEHTVLFLALCRAAGIPARAASGIVYSDEMMLPGFYYHAWAEVWVADPEGNGSWMVVDPTFNQDPADATHVRLIEGDLEEMIRLMQVMGKLRVEVGDYR